MSIIACRSRNFLETGSPSTRRGQGLIRACRAAFAFAAFVFPILPASTAFAAKLGGPYYVDDAEIGKPGSCEVESWSSFAANGDR
ncbi:MAG: hypothetical protein ACXU9C_08945, partial [Xanthobacteraceae bacterium]